MVNIDFYIGEEWDTSRNRVGHRLKAQAGGWRKAIGPLHPSVADCLDWFASAIEDVEKLGEAQARLEQQMAAGDVLRATHLKKEKK